MQTIPEETPLHYIKERQLKYPFAYLRFYYIILYLIYLKFVCSCHSFLRLITNKAVGSASNEPQNTFHDTSCMVISMGVSDFTVSNVS